MAEKKEKPVKAKKEKPAKIEKKLPAKKLPGLFKKSYTQKAFEKKIVSKVYVPADIAYVKDLFKSAKDKKGNPVLAVPADSEFTKKEIKRLKLLAKDIKNNRSRIKAGSFIAVAAVIAAVGITVTMFKNPVAKMAIRSTMQGIFGAKCDIGAVKVEIFGAQITVNNLAQASSDDDMKNIFQFDKLDLNFNLAQLLRARFDAENIEITGIAVNTERKTSGKLPVKPKSAKEKEEKTDSTGFYESIKAKCGTDTDAAKNAITELFAMYDPKAMAENVKENLQSQKVAKEVEEELKALVESWKNKPAELQKQVEEVKASTAKLTSLNVSNVKDPASAAALIKEIESATSSVKNAKTNMETSLKSFDGDKAKVNELKKKLADAIAADKALLNDQLSVLDVSKAKDSINNTINQAGYALLGQYYPYLKQLISYAGSMKGSSSDGKETKESKAANKKAKEKAKKESKRFAGRYVYWKADRVPKFLIEKAHGSGNGIDISATNISSDMNKRGEPWLIKGTVVQAKRTHNAGLTVDSRTGSANPLISGTYSGNNFPMTLDLAKKLNSEGVPVFDGISTISAKLTADSDFSFSGSGTIAMKQCKVTASELGNETANRIYSTALSSINSLNVVAKVGFSEKDGVDMKIDTDFDKLLANAISKVASSEMANAKNEAMAKLNDQLGNSEAANKYISQFTDISSKLSDSKAGVDSINSALEAKKTELQKKATAAAASAVSDKAASAAGSLLKGLKK